MTGRVAIYAAPGIGSGESGGGPLLERAEAWLGRSVERRTVGPSAFPAGWNRSAVDEITVDARRYGFHGTLKAPFRLADGCTIGALEDHLQRFAAENESVELPQLSLARIGDFFALVPGHPAAPLHALANALVADFDRYRAPATAAEIARRRPESLTPRQRELFEQWGYPYVFDEFRFHLTLTDRIAPNRQSEIHDVLVTWFEDSIGRTLPIDAIALFTEAEAGAPFALHSIHPLRSAPSPLRAPAALDNEGIS